MSVDAIWAAAGTQLWQVTAAIVVVGVAVWAFCRRRPQVAYALWVVVLVKCVVPPVWSSSVGVFSWWDVHLKGDRPWLLDHWKETMTVPVHEVREMVPGTNETRTVKFIIASEAVRAGISWRKMSLLAWGMGTSVLGAIWLVRAGRLRRRIERSAVEVPGEVEEMFGELRRRLEVRGHVRLRVSKEAIGPGLFGVVRPVVVVPAAMLEEGANERLRMVLAHELAHVRRKDHWVAGLQMMAQVGWWFHPLVWWMNQEVGRARELSCDEAVMAELGCAGEAYGQMLVDVLKMRHGMRMGAFAPGMRAVQVTARRLEHVMTRPARRRMPVWGWVVAGVMGMVLLPGAGVVLERGKARAAENGAAPAASQPAKALTFQGIIVEKETGKPIAGAKVTVHRVHPPGTKPDSLKPVAPSEVITTDSAGRYSVYVPPEQAADPTIWIATEVRSDGYMTTSWDGWAIGLIERKNKEGDATFGLKEEMYPAEEVHGILNDEQGRGLAHARITAFSRLIMDAESECWEETETDDQGRYSTKVVKGGEIAVARAYPKDAVNVIINIDKKRGDMGVAVAKAGLRMKGVVVDAAGKPVAGAEVQAAQYFEQNGKFYSPSDGGYSRRTKADEAGKFTFDPLEAGPYAITVVDVAGDDVIGRIKLIAGFVPVHVALSPAMDAVEIRALPTVRVHTKTVDPAGKAMKGVSVPVSGEMDGSNINACRVEGDNGEEDNYLPKGVKNAQILMHMVSDGITVPRYRRGADGRLQSDQDIELGTLNEDVTDIYIVRYRRSELTVKVVGEDGNIMKKFLPHIEYVDKNIKMAMINGAYTNGVKGIFLGELPTGGWHASELLPGEELRVSATAEGYEEGAEVMTLKEGEKREVTLTLKRKGK